MCRSALVVLVAVFAMSALATASASAALPEIVNKEGKALVKNKFRATVEFGEVTFQTFYTGEPNAYCPDGTIAGAFSGLKTGEVTFTLTKCKSNLGGKCTEIEKGKERETLGEMVIPFSLTVVYTDKASKELALLFQPKGEPTYECVGSEFTMHGGFLVPIPQEHVNKLLEVGKTLNLHTDFVKGKKEQYENEKGEKVETGLTISQAKSLPVESGAYFELTPTFEEAVEFKG
jgi:hypothetical protein